MAKIDTNLIEGYAEMSAEEKLKALESFEFEDNASENERLKNAISKANSEAAEWKRKHNALLSEEDKKAQESANALEEVKRQLAEMQKEKILATYVANYTSQGYPEELAVKAATAMANGEMDEVFAVQKNFLEIYSKNLKAEVMKNTPKPPRGSGSGVFTKADFLKLGTKEQMEFIKDNPNWQKELK